MTSLAGILLGPPGIWVLVDPDASSRPLSPPHRGRRPPGSSRATERDHRHQGHRKSNHFVRDTTHNQIAEKLRSAFFGYYRYNASAGEVQSWQNSLRATAMVFQEAGLDDHGVLLEYQLPLTSRRLDCIVTGHDAERSANAVIIELKQWSDVDGASVVGDKVVTWVGGGHRDVLHPSVQVGRYRQYLADNHEVFHADPSPLGLSA